MTATTWRRLPSKPRAAQAALLFAASIMLNQCSAVPLADPAQPAPPADYGRLIADAVKKFQGFASLNDFQISGLRWVHAATGGSWLVCLRYNDRGKLRFYAFFLDGGIVANARYDVRTDHCAEQQYTAFDVTTGTVGWPTQAVRQPIY